MKRSVKDVALDRMNRLVAASESLEAPEVFDTEGLAEKTLPSLGEMVELRQKVSDLLLRWGTEEEARWSGMEWTDSYASNQRCRGSI